MAAPRVTRPPLCVRSVGGNGLDGSAKQAVRAAWGGRDKDRLYLDWT